MNKKLVIILISIVSLAVIALVSFYFINKNNDSLNTSVTSGNETTENIERENETLENIKKENQKAKDNSENLTQEEKEKTEKELNQVQKDLENLAKNQD